MNGSKSFQISSEMPTTSRAAWTSSALATSMATVGWKRTRRRQWSYKPLPAGTPRGRAALGYTFGTGTGVPKDREELIGCAVSPPASHTTAAFTALVQLRNEDHDPSGPAYSDVTLQVGDDLLGQQRRGTRQAARCWARTPSTHRRRKRCWIPCCAGSGMTSRRVGSS